MVLNIHKSFYKLASELIVQKRTEKIDTRKFFYFRKMPGFNMSECSWRQRTQAPKYLLVECNIHVGKKIGPRKKIRKR